MLPRWSPCALGLLLLTGCVYPVRQAADRAVCNLASHPIDPEPLQVPAPPETLPTPQPTKPAEPKADKATKADAPAPARPVLRVSFEEQEPTKDTKDAGPKGLLRRMEIPPGL
ncbi:MAG TPA: hypothetical protein VJ739_10900, partial [Gemmataceae bacterium]|nr:hypothetical protein [Gemmataceae bacterium]